MQASVNDAQVMNRKAVVGCNSHLYSVVTSLFGGKTLGAHMEVPAPSHISIKR